MVTSKRIFITGNGSISSLGATSHDIEQSYRNRESCLSSFSNGRRSFPVGAISPRDNSLLQALLDVTPAYRKLDRVTQLAILATRGCIDTTNRSDSSRTAVILGSSRGATETLERSHKEFLESPTAKVSPLTSPTTTLGNISSWVAQDIGAHGLAISHSVTCSTALHSFLMGIAWLRSGMCSSCIVGGAEAPLTPFTIAQMESLRIYAPDDGTTFPCQPGASGSSPQNRMVLGEGAASFALELLDSPSPQSLAEIVGFGMAQERIAHATDLDASGEGFIASLDQALGMLPPSQRCIDAIVLHAPGTLRGDAAELNAIRALFPTHAPILTSAKWKTGHTLGAAGALSVDYAIRLLRGLPLLKPPYPSHLNETSSTTPLTTIAVNAAGFGGNIASLILRAL